MKIQSDKLRANKQIQKYLFTLCQHVEKEQTSDESIEPPNNQWVVCRPTLTDRDPSGIELWFGNQGIVSADATGQNKSFANPSTFSSKKIVG